MKIAFVVHDYQPAGVGQTRYVGELARRFSRGHEVHVFANRVEGDQDQNIHFHHVPAWRKNSLTGILSFAATSTLQIRNGFDIVHSQGFCGFYGNVLTAHICNRAWHRALQRLEGGVTPRESIFNAFATTLEYSTYRRARQSEVIAVSERIAKDIREVYQCPGRIHVIHHGVNLDLFAPQNRSRFREKIRQELAIDETEFVYVYAGHLRKGARACIQALARLEHGVLLCISPTQSDPYRSLAQQLGVTDRVRFLNFTANIEQYYAAGDALLLPSLYDAFGMVVTEAMASGLPAIVSREAGASELIRDRENGLLLNEATSDTELAALMQILESDRTRSEQLGREARKTVESLSWDSVAEKTMQVYEALLAKKRTAKAS